MSLNHELKEKNLADSDFTPHHYIFVHNIVAPYRVSLFNKLKQYGLNFEVFFMQLNEEDRSWTVDLNQQSYPYRLFPGFYKVLFGYSFYFNPQLIWAIIRDKKSELILGASWNNFNIAVILLLKRLGIIRNRVHMWSEANHMSLGARKKSFFKSWLRKIIFHSIDGVIVVPGSTAIETFHRWNIEDHQFILLPNMVQEEIIEAAVPHENRNHALPLVVIPARLIEPVKGQKNFFQAIGRENIERAVFYLIGDGPDEKMLREYIQTEKLGAHISLLGFMPFSETTRYLKDADIFCLPSFSDACPLSIYEALASELPLLVSERCGNTKDAVEAGRNGEIFNPEDPASIRTAFEKLFDNPDSWKQMGSASRKIFDEKIQSSVICRNFIAAMENADFRSK